MHKKPISRIIEIRLYKSKKNPKFSHAVATILPCGHHQYLGLTRTPKVMKEYNSLRVNSAKIWIPMTYDVTDKQHCHKCPSDNIWIKDLPTIDEISDRNEGLGEDDE